MTVTYDGFVAAFPAFNLETDYPKDQVNFWIGQAPNQINTARMGRNADLATMLYVAHNLVLFKRDAMAAEAGGIPGEAKGPVTGKTVDKVTVSYDTAAATTDGAGEYNLTSYGQRLWRMMRAAAAGGLYVPGRVRSFDPPYR
jgi:hypothetical protein